MTETKLPEELEEQAMLHALGILDPEDRQAFMVRLPGESALVRQAVRAYQATAEALAASLAPVPPPSSLRERLVNRVAKEAAREGEQFELAANALVLGGVPVTPRDSVRERLMSRIGGPADVPLDVKGVADGLVETPVSKGGGRITEGRAGFLDDSVGSPPHRFAHAWRHFLVTLYTSLRLCWKAFLRLLRTIPIRSETSRLSGTKIGFQQSGQGLTFIKAAEESGERSNRE